MQQVALLSQRDRATCLLVEILQIQNIAIVWHYLRDPTFSRFYTKSNWKSYVLYRMAMFPMTLGEP